MTEVSALFGLRSVEQDRQFVMMSSMNIGHNLKWWVISKGFGAGKPWHISLMVLLFLMLSGAVRAQSATLPIQEAEGGSVKAQVQVGRAYLAGEGLARDPAKALSWFKKAAEQGDPEAQISLGLLYEEGRGTERDFGQAVLWYRKAAEQGDSDGQRALGVMYELGKGVEKDPEQAAFWYRKAAEQGLARAQVNLGILYEEGKGLVQDFSQALFWYQKSVEHDYPRGQTYLGRLYERGLGVEKDLAKARSWYERAAKQGYAKARAALQELDAQAGQAGKPLQPQPPLVSQKPSARGGQAEEGPAGGPAETGQIVKERIGAAVAVPGLGPEQPAAAGPVPEAGGTGEQPTGAKEAAKQADKAPAESAVEHFYQGVDYGKAGKHELAIAEFEKALAFDPGNANTYENLAIMYVQSGAPAKAIEAMNASLRLDPDDSLKHATMGIIYHADKQTKEALGQYQQAARLNPGLGWVYNNMAALYFQQQNFVRAWEGVAQAKALGYPEAELITALMMSAPQSEIKQIDVAKSERHLRQILVATRPEADRLLSRLQSGEDFIRLASRNSLPPYHRNGGYLGLLLNQELPVEVTQAVSGLQPFSFSPVVATGNGYAILQSFSVLTDLLGGQ